MKKKFYFIANDIVLTTRRQQAIHIRKQASEKHYCNGLQWHGENAEQKATEYAEELIEMYNLN